MDAYNRAKRLLEENMNALNMLAKTLLEKETLDGAEIDKILKDAGIDIKGEEKVAIS